MSSPQDPYGVDAPTEQIPTQHPAQQRPNIPPVKRRRRWPLVAGGAVVLLLGLFVAAGIAGSGQPATPPQAAGSAASSSAPATPAPTRATPTTTVPAAPAPVAEARAITAREWLQIAKSPAAHIGDRIIVYGQVTQFDSATGTTSFRANVDGVRHPVKYGYADYDTNTILTGLSSDLTELVQDDLFKAEATVAGALSYETTMGGQMTVPKLTVTKIVVIGSV